MGIRSHRKDHMRHPSGMMDRGYIRMHRRRIRSHQGGIKGHALHAMTVCQALSPLSQAPLEVVMMAMAMICVALQGRPPEATQ